MRINGFASGMVQDDLTAVFSGSHDVKEGLPDAVMLPKCDSAEQLAEVSGG